MTRARNLYREGALPLQSVDAMLVARKITAAEREWIVEPVEAAEGDGAGMTVAEVVRSLSYRPTLDEYRQACGWLGLDWDESMTRAELKALIDAAAGSEAE